jgi:hypothetical protein
MDANTDAGDCPAEELPVAATVTAAPRVSVRLRVVGMPTTDQLHDLTQTVASSHDLGVALALDLRELDPIIATADALRKVATYLGELGASGLRRVAVVAAESTGSYGLARMLQLQVDSAGVATNCFKDDSSAAQWLLAPVADCNRVRKFWSPSGRHWTAELYELPRGVGVRRGGTIIPAKAVVRFSSGDLTLDLASYPGDWAHRSDDELIELLRKAYPPAFAPLGDMRDQM